jgi:hypothetical protein
MYYQYKVTYYNDYDGKTVKDEGIVYAENYGDAATKVKDDYGNGLMDMYLQEWDSTRTLSLDEIKDGFGLT